MNITFTLQGIYRENIEGLLFNGSFEKGQKACIFLFPGVINRLFHRNTRVF